MTEPTYDIVIIGGGINGCGIARDAAGRGLKVALFEQNDLAQGTSSASTKLIHGGLRYLEYYEFRLVREALTEREVLLGIAPHIVWPMRFVLPFFKGLRPAWMIRLGLFLYDYIGGRKLLPPTRDLDLRTDPAGRALKPGFAKAFEYSDCWVDDARFVVLNARSAQAKGALVQTRAKVAHAERADGHWRVHVEHGGATQTVTARVLVNAAGPWVGDVLRQVVPSNSSASVRMVQGSHIIVPKVFDHDRAYFFQNADGRIIFAIPYETDFTLVGTTDQDYHADPAKVAATQPEIDYLCKAASEYFARPITSGDVVWTYSGVRPLYDDGASKAQEATRDYVLHLDDGDGRPPMLSVFGGKITTYRRLAESALEKLGKHVPDAVHARRGWTGKEALPGGDFPLAAKARLAEKLHADKPYLTAAHCRRLIRSYGTDALAMMSTVRTEADLGRHFGADLYEREVRYLIENEWAKSGADVLWRRSKIGLRLLPDEAAAVDAFVAAQVAIG